MGRRPKPPSRIDVLSLPVFGMDWYADPATGFSMVAMCGGGGSAKTGVHNFITVKMQVDIDESYEFQISTGDQAGVAVQIVQHPFHRDSLRLYVAFPTDVRIYTLHTTMPPQGESPVEEVILDDVSVVVGSGGGTEVGKVSVGDGVYGIAINSMVTQLAVSCESGTVKIYPIDPEDETVADIAQYTLEGHSKTVSSVVYSLRNDILVSSAKDGTARVWNMQEPSPQENNDDDFQPECLATLNCSGRSPDAPPPKASAQVLVKGCAFGDLDGNVIYSISSTKRGAATLSEWQLTNNGDFICAVQTEVSPKPISAMSISEDGGILALGSVEGDVMLWSIEKWKMLKKFPEIHDLPVTCIAARPFPVQLHGDPEDGAVQMDAISASADSKLGWLTRSKAPRKRRGTTTWQQKMNFWAFWGLIFWVLSPIGKDMWEKCGYDWHQSGLSAALQCVRDDVIIAPKSRPGILVPPH